MYYASARRQPDDHATAGRELLPQQLLAYDLSARGLALSWARPADGPRVGLVHDGTSVGNSPGRFRRGERFMKIWHLCYAALGIAVARWVFKREAVPLNDPIQRLRSSGLL